MPFDPNVNIADGISIIDRGLEVIRNIVRYGDKRKIGRAVVALREIQFREDGFIRILKGLSHRKSISRIDAVTISRNLQKTAARVEDALHSLSGLDNYPNIEWGLLERLHKIRRWKVDIRDQMEGYLWHGNDVQRKAVESALQSIENFNKEIAELHEELRSYLDQ